MRNTRRDARSHVGRRLIFIIGWLVPIGIAGLFLFGLTGATSGSNGTAVALTTVSPEQLLAAHLNLEQPTSTTPSVSRSSAETAARAAFPMAGTVRESVLAYLNSPNYPADTGKVYWVVSLELNGMQFPSTGPFGSKATRPQPNYLLVFIDAQTGQYVFATMG